MSDKKRKKAGAAPVTEEEKAFDEQQQTRRNKLKAFCKRLKWYHILAAAVVLLIVSFFVGWHFKPKKDLNVVVLDKTILSYSEDEDIIKENIYRKHQGLFWLLNRERYVKEDGSDYDYTKDYYGPFVDENGAYDHTVELNEASPNPDMVYLSDAYGMGNDTFGYFNGSNPLDAGISADDMSYVSFAHESGAPIVAEMALFSTPLSDSVKSQLVSLLGVTPTKWLGRYIVDLQDFTDVPDWAPDMYEQQEGVEWRFRGPGILLISTDGKIKILEQNVDFNSKNLLQIYIKDEYKDEFGGCDRCNFYNWFELVEPNYGVEDIATFEFDLNATGMEKIKDISNTPRFCAISRRQEQGYAPVYFFAGDFNDYVNGNRYGCFLFSNYFFKFLSYDRQGDISNFYWRFYNPLMRKILDQTGANDHSEKTKEHSEVSRVNNGAFQVLENEKWRTLSIKAAAVNAQEPGEARYSRDFTFYEKLIAEAAEMGVNCLTAKSLYPPEFYAAVNRHNKQADSPIYIQQRITAPPGLDAEDYLTDKGLAAWKERIESTVKALHGNAEVENGTDGKAAYLVDVSAYVLCVTVDPGLTSETVPAINGASSYSFSGEYTKSCTGIKGFAAYLYKEQGEMLVEALKAAKDTGLAGAVIYDLNDTWSGVSDEMKKFTASDESTPLWHNTADRAEMTGIIAMDSVQPETPGLVLTDDDLAQAVSMSADAGYMYVTVQLLEEIDYNANALFVGIDTFQRNDGEYFYAKDFTANSLSGMEFSLRFDGKQNASLYVIKSYDRSHGTAVTKESYAAAYNEVADLTYGSFTSGDTQFYQTGSTIYVRLPWTWLNIADPSRLLVINDPDLRSERAKTVTTNGFLVSVMVGERKSGDLYYGFPQEKHDPGYKTFSWKKWDTTDYTARRRESFEALKKYFAAG